jgi:imidazolonepropionase-like amidohydrolase
MKKSDYEVTRRLFLATCASATVCMAAPGCGRPTAPTLDWSAPADGIFALTNVNLVYPELGSILDDAILIIRDQKIEAILQGDSSVAPTLPCIDCGGGYLIPGLINAHTHITMASTPKVGLFNAGALREQILRNYEDAIAWGVTTVRDLGAGPKILLADREKIDAGELSGPRIQSSLAIIRVPGGYPDFLDAVPKMAEWFIGKTGIEIKTPQQGRDAVKKLHDDGADWIKIAFDHLSVQYGHGALPVFTDAQLEAIRDEAAKLSIPVTAHHLFDSGFERGLQFQLDSLEHMVTDVELTDEQIERAVDSKIPFIPTMTSRMNLAFTSAADELKDDPAIEQAVQFKKTYLLPDYPNHCTEKIREDCAELVEFYESEGYRKPNNQKIVYDPTFFTHGVVFSGRNLSRMIQAGAVIGIGNDSGIPLTFPGMLHHELVLMNMYGMSPAQALASATSVNARMMGLEDQLGSIEIGKLADLVLLEGDPLADLHNVAKVRAVFKDGKLISKSDKFSGSFA